MSTTELREKLHHYIDIADDKIVEAIYTLFGERLPDNYSLLENEEIIAELDKRSSKLEDGSDPGLTLNELKANLNRRKQEQLNNKR